jgi:hypothetical protein
VPKDRLNKSKRATLWTECDEHGNDLSVFRIFEVRPFSQIRKPINSNGTSEGQTRNELNASPAPDRIQPPSETIDNALPTASK